MHIKYLRKKKKGVKKKEMLGKIKKVYYWKAMSSDRFILKNYEFFPFYTCFMTY
jgi:hypothetical protein